MRDYNSLEYKNFRYEVKNRDKYQCRWPGCSKKKKLQVHHILPYSSHALLRYITANGITLCKLHHALVKGKELIYAEMFMRIVNG